MCSATCTGKLIYLGHRYVEYHASVEVRFINVSVIIYKMNREIKEINIYIFYTLANGLIRKITNIEYFFFTVLPFLS